MQHDGLQRTRTSSRNLEAAVERGGGVDACRPSVISALASGPNSLTEAFVRDPVNGLAHPGRVAGGHRREREEQSSHGHLHSADQEAGVAQGHGSSNHSPSCFLEALFVELDVQVDLTLARRDVLAPKPERLGRGRFFGLLPTHNFIPFEVAFDPAVVGDVTINLRSEGQLLVVDQRRWRFACIA